MSRRIIALSAGVLGCAVIAGGALADSGSRGPVVRVHDGSTVEHRARLDAASPQGGVAGSSGYEICEKAALAWHGQALPSPESGALSLGAFFNVALVNNHETIAFFSNVSGAERNQGIFIADENGITPIVLGCGASGGGNSTGTCGDPAPEVGGNFTGFFSGTFGAPAFNDNGDVLFVADVFGGSSPRGLFMYRASDEAIVKVAAVGDASPIGGTFSQIGPGSINNHGHAAFLARVGASQAANIYVWKDGVIAKHVAVGDAVPGGGTFTIIGSESIGFQDGTSMPVGPLPAINDSGQIAFRGIVQGGIAERGIFISTDGVHEWAVKRNDPAPAPGPGEPGGTYFSFEGALLNNAGEIAFFADILLGPGQFTAGWFVGAPKDLRRAIAFFDEIEGAQVWGLAVSRNPMRALNDAGDLVVWCNRLFPDEIERESLVVNRANGESFLIAEQGEPAPNGGTIGIMQSWPSHNATGQATLSSATPGAPGGAFSAHSLLTPCPQCAFADLNCDGSVGVADLLILLAAWGPCADCAPGMCAADLTGDCNVGVADLLILLANWG